MRIKELFIEDYKILKDFNIKFDHQLTVIIGKNGSGKSTLLEFVAKRFFDLYEHFVLEDGKKPSFDFKLRYDVEYQKETYEVYITSNKKTKEYYEVNIKKNGARSKKYSKAQINEDFVGGYKDILPQNVVMYYSGISTALQDRFLAFQGDFILGSLDGEIKIEQPFFYFLPNNFTTILLGLLSYQYGDIPETLSKQFGVSAFKEIKIKIRKPYWARPKSIADDFWGAKGDLNVFLQKLSESCHDKATKDGLIEFTITSKDELQKVWEFYGEEKSLFEYLTTIQANDLIESIDINLIKNDKEISHDRLSEGEKQILVVYGLIELLITGNTLFLLDEPDTYLHPAWQREFIEKIKKIDAGSQTNFIVTTHSPQTLSNLRERDVLSMEGGRVFSIDANGLYGRDSNAILEEVMGACDMSPEAHEWIEKINKAITLKDLDQAQDSIEQLKEYLSVKDPFFAVAEMRVERLKRKLQ